MKFGLDMTYPPTVDQATHMQSLGYTFCIAYVGGPRASADNAWHQIDGERYPVRDLSPFFRDGFLPCYVGRNVPYDQGWQFTAEQGITDGHEANTYTGACGFDSDSVVVLDVQYGTYERYPLATLRYIAGFVSRCNAAGHPVGVYGDIALMNALRQGLDVDGKWGADQLLTNRTDEPSETWSRFDPASPPPWMYWQCGNGTVAGVSVDYNTATDDALFAKYAG